MPSTRDIRRRIKSVKNTAQITKAMQMVAASKMRKAQMAALAGRPYASLMNTMLAEVIAGAGDFQHEFMEHRGGKKRAIIVVSSDKGLAGALNSNLTREVARQEKEAIFIAAGKKGAQFISRTKRNLAAEFTYKDAPLFADKNLEKAVRKHVFEKRDNDKPLVQADVENLSVIKADGMGITNLAGLEKCISLQELDRKSTRLNSSHVSESRMPSSA